MILDLHHRPARNAVVAAALALAVGFGAPAVADEPMKIAVTLRDHRFTPSEIHVPQGAPVILTIRNEDAAAEEFDSSALKIEKVIAAGSYGVVHLRPLGPGRYPFTGEFHSDTAKGVVVSE